MKEILCSKENFFSEEEKGVFAAHLCAEGIAVNVWDLFGEWVARSGPPVNFFYLKARRGGELIGLGLFLEVRPVDLRTSYKGLRQSPFLGRLAGGVSVLSRNCLCVSFRNLITANLTRPFFYRDPSLADPVMRAMLQFLKNDRKYDMVTVIDTLDHHDRYRGEGFRAYPSSSEAVLEPGRYEGVAGYLNTHKNLKKNLARKKFLSFAEITRGSLGESDLREMRACVANSIEESNVNTPCQKFFESHIFDTGAYRTDDYVHILVRVDGVIAGFHTYLESGRSLGGVLGGFNRAHTRNHFVYERVILASLEYALARNLCRVNYSLIDNRTKLRLVDSRVPCALYFYSRNALNSKVFDVTYRYNDIGRLAELEKKAAAPSV